MASKKTSKQTRSDTLPFGAGALDEGELAVGVGGSSKTTRKKRTSASASKGATRKAKKTPAKSPAAQDRQPEPEQEPARAQAPDARAPRRNEEAPAPAAEERAPRERATPEDNADGASGNRTAERSSESGEAGERGGRRKRRRWQDRRSRRKRGRQDGDDGRPRGAGEQASATQPARPAHSGGNRPPQHRGQQQRDHGRDHGSREHAVEEVEGLLLIEAGNHGHLRQKQNGYLPKRDDVHVSPRLVQKYNLTEGAILRGPRRRGQGRHKWDLADVVSVDGKNPQELKNLPRFKSLTSIDPDFHYAVGDTSGEVALKVVDLICPIGRGQRGLIVAPPRSGKTILLQQFARAIEQTYPEVHLMVLLVDERPEEATEWTRATGGEVFVSTNDEPAKKHVELCEAVWKRCQRLVELGEDVILLIDSLTRMGRAYNNVKGNTGKTMSGGIDSRAMERPKQFFGAARNTETAGSLTILATALIETGSRMDQVIFEEFKGTGNMELVLARRLADRRIFPAIDLERSGTRKEEKLLSSRRLKRVNTLRRVVARMHWAEAMELLISKLDEVEKIDDFLERFEVDPEA